MRYARMHREDVKAALRKQYGSIAEFERRHDLPVKSVSGVLSGKPSARVTEAIEDALKELSVSVPKQSDCSSDTAAAHRTHRLNSAAR